MSLLNRTKSPIFRELTFIRKPKPASKLINNSSKAGFSKSLSCDRTKNKSPKQKFHSKCDLNSLVLNYQFLRSWMINFQHHPQLIKHFDIEKQVAEVESRGINVFAYAADSSIPWIYPQSNRSCFIHPRKEGFDIWLSQQQLEWAARKLKIPLFSVAETALFHEVGHACGGYLSLITKINYYSSEQMAWYFADIIRKDIGKTNQPDFDGIRNFFIH